MSTLTFIGKSQTRKRNSGYDLWIEAGNTGTEQDYELALHGYTSSQVRLLKRYNSTPTTTYKTEGGSNVTYTFETNGVTFAGSDAGWSATPPSGTGDLYAIYATALSKGTTDLIEPDEWTAPALLSTEGSPGQPGRNVTTVFVFKSSPTQPQEPAGVITYNFVDGTVSGLSDGWSKTDTSGDKVWISSATASSIDTTATLTGWSTPTVWKQKGDTGVGLTQPTEEYAVNNDSTNHPQSGWTTFSAASAQLDETHRFLWNKETMNYSDGTSSQNPSYHILYRYTTDGTNAKNITSVNEYSAYGSDSAPISPASKTDPDWSTNWGLTPKVPDATAGHHYVWQCEELVFDDNTTSALTTARRVAKYVEDGKDADVFDFTVSSQTYAKNLRVVDTNSIKVTVSLQGQYSSSTVTVKHDNTSLSYITKKNGTAVTPTSSISVADTDTLEVSIPMDVSFQVTIGMGSLEKVINCVDETEYGHNYGLLSTAPTISSSPRLIFEAGKERDYYTSTVDGNTYEYVGNNEWIESESTPKLLTGLTDILNDTTYDLNNYQDANNVSLFRRILAKQVIAEVLKALQLIIGTEGTGLYVNISEDPESNQRRFVVKFGNDTIFEINPTTGTTSMTNATVIGDFISSGFATQKASDTHTLQKSISNANRWKEEDFIAAAITQFNAHNSYFGSRGFYFSDTSGSLYTKDSNLATVSDTYTKIGAYTPYETSSVSYSTSLGSGIGQFGSWYFCYKNSSRRVLVFVDSYYTGDRSAAAKQVAAAAYKEISNFQDYTCKPLAMPWYATPMSSSQVATVSYGGTTTWNCASHLSVYYYDFSTISLDTTNKAFTGTVTINSTVVVTATAQNKYYIRFNTDRNRIVISNSSQVTVYTISDYNNYSWALDINVEAGVEGIKARNVMPFDSSSSKVGTSALPFSEGNFTKLTNSQNSNSTVWGAVFN